MGIGISLSGSARYETLGAGTGVGTTVTTGNNVAVFGSLATIGTASFDYDGFYLCQANGGTGRYLYRVYVNTGGADELIVDSLIYDFNIGFQTPAPLFFPIAIPKGAVIKVSAAATRAFATPSLIITGFQGDGKLVRGFRGSISCTDLTSADPTNHLTLSGTTQTGWTQICASTPKRISGLTVSPTTLGNSMTSGSLLLDVGWGASGSERVLFTTLINIAPGSVNTLPSFLGPFPCDLPAGTRLAIRGQANAANTSVISAGFTGLLA